MLERKGFQNNVRREEEAEFAPRKVEAESGGLNLEGPLASVLVPWVRLGFLALAADCPGYPTGSKNKKG